MAYKFQVGSATMSGSLVQEGEIKILNEAAAEHAKLTQAGVVSGSGEAAFGSIKLGGTAVTATAAELNYLDNSDLTAADITKLAALTATAAEINYLDNSDLTAADITKLAALTATAAEINYLDNDALTAADITKLAAIDASATELNYLDLTNAIGTVGASEAVVVDANKDASGFRNLTIDGTFSDGNYTFDTSGNVTGLGTVGCGAVTSTGAGSFVGTLTADTSLTLDAVTITTAEIGVLDSVTPGTAAASKALVLDASRDIATVRKLTLDGLLSSSAEISGSVFWGSGAGLTNISSDTVDTTTSNASATRYIPFVDQSTGADGESLLIHSALSINPSTGVFGVAGSAPGLTVGSAVLAEAELEVLDGASVGSAVASKALVVDASRDLDNLNDVSAAGLTLSDLTAGRLPLVSTSGLLADDGQFGYVTNRAQMNGFVALSVSSSASGSFYALDGGLASYDESGNTVFSVTKDGLSVGESKVDINVSTGQLDMKGDLGLLHDGVYVGFGADEDVKLTHVADTGLLLNSSMQLQFGDSGTYISQEADGNLEMTADAAVNLSAPAVEFPTDGTILKFGDDSETTLTHVHDTGLLLNSSMQFQFRDSAISIASRDDGMLDIEADNSIDINVNGSEMLSVQNNLVVPGADGTVDLGSSGLEFKDLYIDGVAYIDDLRADALGAALNCANQAMTNINVDGGAIDGTTVGATTPAAGVFTTLQANGQVTIGDASGDGVNWNAGSLDMTSNSLTWQIKDGVDGFSGNGALLMFTGSGGDFLKVNTSGSQKGVVFPRTFYPSSDDAVDIGASDKKFKDIYIDGVAYLDDVDGVTADFSSTLNVDGLSTMAGITADGAINFSNTSIQFSGDLDTAFAPSADAIYFRDADGSFHSRSWSTIMGQIAGAGLTNTNGVLSSDASPTPTDHGDAAGTLVEGLNFSDTAFTAARSWTLPASPDLGDKIIVKAPTNAGTYNLTIVKVGSQEIDGVAQDLLIESDSGAVTLVYAKANRWVIS